MQMQVVMCMGDSAPGYQTLSTPMPLADTPLVRRAKTMCLEDKKSWVITSLRAPVTGAGPNPFRDGTSTAFNLFEQD